MFFSNQFAATAGALDAGRDQCRRERRHKPAAASFRGLNAHLILPSANPAVDAAFSGLTLPQVFATGGRVDHNFSTENGTAMLAMLRRGF